jgi:glycine hydroxymethyltransferase
MRAALRAQALRLRPKLITIGGSLNLFAHPVRELRAIADEVGATLLFDAAHLSGMIAGGAWPQPLDAGAHAMPRSTYKSLGGPPAGLIVTRDDALAEKLDAIAYPVLTANCDAGKTPSLAITLLDWKRHGRAYGAAMAATAAALARELAARGLPVFAAARGGTRSHQLAIEAARFGGGQAASKRLRRANILACGIGLPLAPVEGDVNGLRLGTPEIARWGMGEADMPELAQMKELDVAIGLHFAPLFVGTFGPDQDYTGFSSGMNNTARLQGQAKGGEILCMDAFVAALGDPSRFGEERSAAVKNVAEPLKFRALR